jgi:hypothetical protein
MTKDDYLIKGFRMRYILLTLLLLLLFNINLYSQTNMKKIINTVNAPAPLGPYNQAILIDNTLYVSGQIALDPQSMKMINGTIEEETKKVMQNIQAILL